MNIAAYALSSASLVGLVLSTAILSLPASVTPSGKRAVPSSAVSFQSAMNGSMAAMDLAMMAAPINGRPDHDFAAMMIPHHRGAVDVARAELLYGTNPVLRRRAQEIMVTQQQEVLVMKQRMDAAAASVPASVPHMEAVFSRDRVYSGGQTSNPISVIDPATNMLLGVIRLGDPVPNGIQPLYRGQLLVHELGFSPDHRTLDVISIGSNSVTLSVAVNSLGLVDLLEVADLGLTPGKEYQLALADSPSAPYGSRVPLTNLKAKVFS